MHFLDIDWLELAERARVWQQLGAGTRRALLSVKPGEPLRRSELERDLQRLVEAEFVLPDVRGATVLPHPRHRPYAVALRAMRRLSVLQAREPERVLRRYLDENLTHEEKRALHHWGEPYYGGSAQLAARVVSVDWLNAALAAGAGDEGAALELGLEGGFSGRDGRAQDVAALARAIVEREGSVPVAELPGLVPGLAGERLTRAVRTALRRVVLFAAMPEPELEPMLAVWPATLRRLRRLPARMPERVPATEVFDTPFLLDDATAVLVGIAGEAPRVKTGFVLFARAQHTLEERLAPLPQWIQASLQGWSPSERLDGALHALELLGLVRLVGVPGKDLRLEATPQARAWLAQDSTARLRALADLSRVAGAGGARRRLGRSRDRWTEDERERGLIPAALSVWPPDFCRALQRSVADAFAAEAEVPGDGFVPWAGFLEYRAQAANPLHGKFEFSAHIGYDYVQRMPVESRERTWSGLLEQVLLGKLIPLGAAALAHLPDGGFVFRLTSVGHYLVGRTDGFALAARPEGAIIVQPNFEVVFLGPAPAAEAAVAPCAQRVGSGIGTLFRITRASVQAAVGAGLAGEDILAALRRVSREPIPANVEREIAGWAAACRRVSLVPALLVHCPDEDTTLRVLATGESALRRLGPTTLELTDPRRRAAFVRKLAAAGIFLQAAAGEEMAPWSGRIELQVGRE